MTSSRISCRPTTPYRLRSTAWPIDLENTTQTLSGIVGGVVSAASEFAAVSTKVDAGTSETELAIGEISIGMDSVAKGAHNQMTSIREISVAVEELSRTAEQIAVGARDQSAAAARSSQRR